MLLKINNCLYICHKGPSCVRSLVCAIYVDTLLVRFFFNWSQSRIVYLKQKETVIAFHK